MRRLRPRPFNIHQVRTSLKALSAAHHSSLEPCTSVHPSNQHSRYERTANPLTSLKEKRSGETADRRRKARRLSRAIRQISAGNTVLIWTITTLGYFVITAGQEQTNALPTLFDGLKAAVGFVLVVCYWKRYWAYLELLRAALHPYRPQVPGLLSSPKPFACCLLECLLHLFLFLPAANYSFSSEYPRT